jgi:hypothetical protein
MRSDLRDVPTAINLSKRTIRTIKQNLFWAFGYNTVGIPIAAGLLYLFGGPLLNPVFAAAAMSLSSVSVLTNALRLKRFTASGKPAPRGSGHGLCVLLAAAAFALSGCWQLDVVGQTSVTAFEKMLEALPEKPEKKQYDNGQITQWTISAPDKTAKFRWSDDFRAGATAEIEIEAAPFIAAGGSLEKLKELYLYTEEGKLIPGDNFGAEAAREYGHQTTPLDAYRQIARSAGSRIGYHAALDHFGVDLGRGNMFEWAKDMSVNDKDIVFVLDPQPFIDAGVNPEKVEGWIFAKVPSMDSAGNKIEVDKLLKPFDLKSTNPAAERTGYGWFR